MPDILIDKYSLANAFAHKGKAQEGAVLGKILSEMPDMRSEIPNLLKAIKQTIKAINKMSSKDQEKKLNELEKLAKQAGFSFVELAGDIGILANGAGLTMALLDVLSELGLKPANFLDVGGGASKERVYKALELIFKLKPRVALVNIFGGITRCDTVAQGIIQALKDFSDAPPMVIRLTGTNEKEAITLLKEANIEVFQDVIDAVKKVKEVLSE